MHTSPAFPPGATRNVGCRAARRRLVVDAPTRVFHWLFALSFVGAYLTADGERWRALHVTLGYTMAGLLAFRVLYGLFGPRHARLGMLLRKLGSARRWFGSIAQHARQRTPGAVRGIDWRQGQNLSMALAVLLLLALVVPLTLSGYANHDDWGKVLGGDWIEDIHEAFANALLAVVLGHISLIAIIGMLRRTNQALPMVTGRVDGAGPDLVKHDNRWLAALLLVGVLAFIGWQWQQSPQGLIADRSAQVEGDRDDDD